MTFLENVYLAISILTAFTLPLTLTLIKTLFKHKRIHKSTYRTLVAASLSLAFVLFFRYLPLDGALFLSKMAEVNLASLIMYAFILERLPRRGK